MFKPKYSFPLVKLSYIILEEQVYLRREIAKIGIEATCASSESGSDCCKFGADRFPVLCADYARHLGSQTKKRNKSSRYETNPLWKFTSQWPVKVYLCFLL